MFTDDMNSRTWSRLVEVRASHLTSQGNFGIIFNFVGLLAKYVVAVEYPVSRLKNKVLFIYAHSLGIS